jgi:hypothetical protein
MTINVGGQLVHKIDCDFPARTNAVDWWGWLDLSEYFGKTAQIPSTANGTFTTAAPTR